MTRRPPIVTPLTHSFPTRRSSDLSPRNRRAVLLKPAPFGHINEAGGKLAQLDLAQIVTVEPGDCVQHAQMHQGRIDCREFGAAVAQASLYVEEMIEEAAMASDPACRIAHWQARQELTCFQYPVACLFPRTPAPFSAQDIGRSDRK